MQKIIFDLEFTGLDNTYISDNEVIQLKMKNLSNGKTFFKNFGSKKELSAHCQLEHKVIRYDDVLFSENEFLLALNEIGAELTDEFIGFGISKDIEMLCKYEISIVNKTDIRGLFQRSEHGFQIATEGSGLEEIYFIATGEVPILRHSDISELYIIEKLYYMSKELNIAPFLFFMPYGHCAGMPISTYVEDYRRAADGYRFNNSDLLADSLDYWVDVVEEVNEDYSDDRY